MVYFGLGSSLYKYVGNLRCVLSWILECGNYVSMGKVGFPSVFFLQCNQEV